MKATISWETASPADIHVGFQIWNLGAMVHRELRNNNGYWAVMNKKKGERAPLTMIVEAQVQIEWVYFIILEFDPRVQ